MTWKELRIQFESVLMSINPNFERDLKLTTDKLNAVLDQQYNLCIDKRLPVYDRNDLVTEDLRPLIKDVYLDLDLKYLPKGDRFINTNVLYISIPEEDLNNIIGSQFDPQQQMNWEVYQNLGLKLVYKANQQQGQDSIEEWSCVRTARSSTKNFSVTYDNYPYIPHPVYTTGSWQDNGYIKYTIYVDPELLNVSRVSPQTSYETPTMYGVKIRVVTHQKFYGVNENYDESPILVSFTDDIINTAMQLLSNTSNTER